ncbi:MAG: hypothetical protein ACRDV9_12775, partial [Acidimicrobiia bacterium]
HWHVAYAFNICGEFKEPFRAFTNPEGIHSHDVAGENRGDGFVHVHPELASAQGENAKLAVFLKSAKAEVSASRIKLPGGVDVSNGDRCKRLDNRESRVRWSVDGKERKGSNPSDYRPKDGEVLTIAFLPDGVDIGKPPVAERGETPADLPGATSSTTDTSSPTSSTTAPVPGETTTSGSSTTTTTTRPTTSTTRATTTTSSPAPTSTRATTSSSTSTTTTP